MGSCMQAIHIRQRVGLRRMTLPRLCCKRTMLATALFGMLRYLLPRGLQRLQEKGLLMLPHRRAAPCVTR